MQLALAILVSFIIPVLIILFSILFARLSNLTKENERLKVRLLKLYLDNNYKHLDAYHFRDYTVVCPFCGELIFLDSKDTKEMLLERYTCPKCYSPFIYDNWAQQFEALQKVKPSH